MDLKVIVTLGLAATLGFLFFPRTPDQSVNRTDYEWIAVRSVIDNEPLRGTTLRRDNPFFKTYDLGFIYRIGSASIEFDGLPKDYDILTSKTKNAPQYDRPLSTTSTSRGEYVYPVVSFPPIEARWIQVVVNDWYGTRPDIKSVKIGARYKRVGPIRSARSKYNPNDLHLLYDGLKFESSGAWIGAKRIEREKKEQGKIVKEISFEPPDEDGVAVLFDLGSVKRVYGVAVTTAGGENNVKRYKIQAGIDDKALKQVFVSETLENKFLTDKHMFNSPINARYVLLAIDDNDWYGSYPALKEVEIYTDGYRPSNYDLPIENHNATQLYYDDCGISSNGINLIQGFPFDRGDGVDPSIRYSLIPGEEVDPNTSPEDRTFFYHYDSVTFLYTNLEPNALYWVKVKYLQEKDGNRVQSLDADGFILHDSMEIPKGKAQEFIYALPPEAYSDGKVELHFNRIFGPNAVVSEVSIYRASGSGSIPIVYEGYKIGDELIQRAPKATTDIKIDGSLDDWFDVYPIVPQQFESAPGSSPAQLYVQWDNNNLYVALKVDRKKLMTLADSPDFLKSPDTLHLFVDTNFNRSQGMYKPGTYHLKFSPLPGNDNLTVSHVHHYKDSISKTIDKLNGVESAVNFNQGVMEYTLEVKLPRDILKEFSPQEGNYIGLNYILSNPHLVERDSSSERKVIKGFQPIFWASASLDAAPKFWGKVELTGSLSGRVAIMDQKLIKNITTFTAGDMIMLVVQDPDRNTDSSSPQTIKVKITGNLTADMKELTLYEVDLNSLKLKMEDPQNEGANVQELALSNNSNFFATKLKTQFGLEPSIDPYTMSVQGKEQVTLEYIDPYYAPKQRDVKLSYNVIAKVGTNASLEIISRTEKPIKIFPAGLRLFFRVTDEDLIRLEGEEGPSKVMVHVTGNSDQEQVELVDEENVGVFVGSIETAYNPVAKPSNGVLEVVGNEKITVTYNDRIQATGETNIQIRQEVTVAVGNDGSITIGKSTSNGVNDFVTMERFNAGDTIIIMVKDADLNKDKESIESVDITVESDAGKDVITVRLTETDKDSDTFVGSLKTSYGLKPVRNDELFEVRGNELVNFTYVDTIRASGETMAKIVATAVVNTGTDGVISLVRPNFLWDLDTINAGDNIYIKVEDAELKTDQYFANEVDVTVVSEKTGDSEFVKLQQKGKTGVFLGMIRTEYSEQPKEDNVLQVQGGEKVTAIYLDKLRFTGETNVPVVDSCMVNMGTMGKIAIYTKANQFIPIATSPDEGGERIFKCGDTLIIHIEDMDVSSSFITVNVLSYDSSPYDKLTFNISKVSGKDGLYTGELKTEYSEKPVENDNVIQVKGKQKIRITYVDAIDEQGNTQVNREIELTARVGKTGTLEVIKLPDEKTGTSMPTETPGTQPMFRSLLAGESFMVLVKDDDLNVDPLAVNYASVTIKGNLLKDELQLVLQETGPNTCAFTGVVHTALSNLPDIDDATLQVTEREVVTVLYVDEVDELGRADTIVFVELLVRTSGKITISFVGEDFKEISNFNAGQRLFVRLDDATLSGMLRKTAHVTVKGNLTKDSEEITLDEIPYPDSKQRGQGIYIGSINTAYGTRPLQDGTLQVQGGEEVKVIYNPRQAEQVIATASVNKGNTGRVEVLSRENEKLSNFDIGDELYIKLEDPDLNTDGSRIDTVDVLVMGEAVTNVRTVRLKETSENSSNFLGSLSTCFGRCMIPSTSPMDTQLIPPMEVSPGELFTIVYNDALTSTGETSVKITTTCRANMLGFATFAINPVTIDGNISDWPLENGMQAGDEGSNVYAQWDRDNIYILAYIVTKDVSVPDPTKYWINADSLEIFLGVKPKGKVSEPSSYYAFWFCPKGAGKDGNEPFVGQLMPKTVWNYNEIAISSNFIEGSGYVLEIRIPIKVLPNFKPYDMSSGEPVIGFNYTIRKSNGQKLQWATVPESDTAVNPCKFGTLIFKK